MRERGEVGAEYLPLGTYPSSDTEAGTELGMQRDGGSHIHGCGDRDRGGIWVMCDRKPGAGGAQVQP